MGGEHHVRHLLPINEEHCHFGFGGNIDSPGKSYLRRLHCLHNFLDGRAIIPSDAYSLGDCGWCPSDCFSTALALGLLVVVLHLHLSWGSTRQVSKETKVNDTKSRDDTIKSDRESPMGFEIVDSRAIETNEYHRVTRKSAAQKTSKVAGPYASAGSAKRDELNLKPKLRSSAPVDVDAVSAGEFSMEVSRTKFDPRKYKDAEEAKRIRNLRRGEC